MVMAAAPIHAWVDREVVVFYSCSVCSLWPAKVGICKSRPVEKLAGLHVEPLDYGNIPSLHKSFSKL